MQGLIVNKLEIQPAAILFPSLVTLVTAYDEKNHPQGFLNTWITNASRNPPTIIVITKRERNTFNSIIKTKSFGVNIVCRELVEIADFFGHNSGKDVDKFQKCNLTILDGKKVHVPIIKECPINFECKLVEQIDIADTVMLIGEVLKSYVNKEVLNEHGFPDVKLTDCLLHSTTHYSAIGDEIAKVGFSVNGD
jgi:flavin reductase (DIM6/NTAB) family NADH-FMN oxidoreductase RutF